MTTSDTTPADPRWRRQPEERPRQILDAAVAVFSEHGIAAAKLEEIAARAGVSKGTIYLYFPSKEDLFREVVRQDVVPLIARADNVLMHGTPTEQLVEYLHHQWKSLTRDESEGWIRLVLLELHKYPDLAEFYRQEVIARSNHVLGDIVRRGVASGEFRAIEPDTAVAMTKAIILMHVLWTGRCSHAPQFRAKPPGQVIADITDFVLHALRADRAATSEPRAGASAA